MTEILRKERTTVVTEIKECETVANNTMAHAEIMYVITEQYITCNHNEKNMEKL